MGGVGEADARLITASPDMLAALEDAKRFIEKRDSVRLHKYSGM